MRGYYSVAPVLDVDRYDDPTGRRPSSATWCSASASSTRTACPTNSKNWSNLHTVYTHGYGVIAAYGNQRPADNVAQETGDEPAWAETDIPPRGELTDLTRPDGYEGRIYFGENSPDYSIVGKRSEASRDVELDLPGGADDGTAEAGTTTTYDGAGRRRDRRTCSTS